MKKNKILLLLLLVVLVLFSSCSKAEETIGSDEIVEKTTTLTNVGELSTAFESTTVKENNTTIKTIKPTKSLESDPQENLISEQTTNDSSANDDKSNQSYTVSLSVNCQNAINNGILNVGTFSDVLPSDGVIMPVNEFEFSDGESALKVIKRVLKQNNIIYTIDSGGYIKMIGGLGEFDCGQQSGWLYKINGNLPSVSSKYYTLSNKDKIEIVYTCNLGNDV